MQVLQTWFHIDITNELTPENVDEEDTMDEEFLHQHKYNSTEKRVDGNDLFSQCNGHVDYVSCDKELKDLQDAIKSVRESVAPLKLYKISSPDAYLTCANTDASCKMLCGGFSNSELRIWDLGQNNVKKKVNRNLSTVELACNITPEPEEPIDDMLQISAGVALRGHDGPVQAAAFLAQEQILLSASHDATMRAWRLSDYSCAAIYRGHNYPIWCLDVSRNGLFIATGSHDKTAKLWSLDRTFPVKIFAGHTFDVNCVQFHPNGAYLATGGADKTIRLWCVGDGRLMRVMHGHRGAVQALAFSPDGSYLASAGDDKKIKIWDLTACTCIHEYRGHHGRVTSLDWSPAGKNSFTTRGNTDPNPSLSDNSLLCSAGMDATVKIWDSQVKTKSVSSQEVLSSTYNTKCSYLVDVQVHPDWVVAIGTKR